MGTLTLRGRGFLAGGITAVLCGIVLGERDLVRLGFVIALVPLLTVWLLRRTSGELTLVRTLEARQLTAGETVRVSLDVHNAGRRTDLLMLRDALPTSLGEQPRFLLEPLDPDHSRRLHYDLTAVRRGRYQLGPAQVRVAEPFGMLERRRQFVGTDTLLVTPRTVPLPATALAGTWTGSGDHHLQALVGGGTPDVTIRDYRRGDDQRLIHWRSTARTGELMVRREEQPRQSRCTLLLDNRQVAHRGSGADSSFEAAVVAAASAVVHLTQQGYQVRLLTAAGEQRAMRWRDGSTAVDVRAHLEQLAVLPLNTADRLAADWGEEGLQGGLVLAVLGHLLPPDRDLFVRLGASPAACRALVVDAALWSSDPAEAPELNPMGWLRGHGWRAAVVGQPPSPAADPATMLSAQQPWLDRALPLAWRELGR